MMMMMMMMMMMVIIMSLIVEEALCSLCPNSYGIHETPIGVISKYSNDRITGAYVMEITRLFSLALLICYGQTMKKKYTFLCFFMCVYVYGYVSLHIIRIRLHRKSKYQENLWSVTELRITTTKLGYNRSSLLPAQLSLRQCASGKQ